MTDDEFHQKIAEIKTRFNVAVAEASQKVLRDNTSTRHNLAERIVCEVRKTFHPEGFIVYENRELCQNDDEPCECVSMVKSIDGACFTWMVFWKFEDETIFGCQDLTLLKTVYGYSLLGE